MRAHPDKYDYTLAQVREGLIPAVRHIDHSCVMWDSDWSVGNHSARSTRCQRASSPCERWECGIHLLLLHDSVKEY